MTLFVGAGALAAVVTAAAGCGSGGDGSSEGTSIQPTTFAADNTSPPDQSTTTAPPATAPPPTTTAATTAPTTTAPTPTTSGATTPSGGSIQPGTYEVTLRGQVSGNPFQRAATITVGPTVASSGTTSEVNPVEICLRSGFPAGTPETGAIWFGTNSACFPTRGADLDLAIVSAAGPTVEVAPDSAVAATLANGFNAAGGVVACIYAPDGGTVTYRFGPDRVEGTVALTGFGGACGAVGTSATYSATFAGERAG